MQAPACKRDGTTTLGGEDTEMDLLLHPQSALLSVCAATLKLKLRVL